MNTYLAIQHTYEEVELGLYQHNTCLGRKSIHKYQASSLLIEKIHEIIQEHKKKISNVSFIAVNQGPGPFTTLRVVIATVNGLSFALGIPLVGVDGITTLAQESKKNNVSQPTIALLNAFNNDVYFAIQEPSQSTRIGAQNITVLLQTLEDSFGKNIPLLFVGNGALMHEKEIKSTFPHAQIKHEKIHPSLGCIAQNGLNLWKQHEHISHQLQPTYLKNTVYNNLDISRV